MQTFVAVAEEEGFAPAARRLGVSPPVVTRSVAALEEHLGTLLLERTTRKVRMTDAGTRYLNDCKRLLAELDDVEAAVSGAHQKASGLVSVTASVMFGRLFVGQSWSTSWRSIRPSPPERSGRPSYRSDRRRHRRRGQNCQAERLDAHIRQSRRGAARHVRRTQLLEEARHAQDTARAERTSQLRLSGERSAPTWPYEKNGETVSFRPRAALLANSSEIGIDAAVAGAGITRARSYMVAADVQAGRLRLILEDFEPEPIPIHLIYREGRRAPARVRAFVDFAVPRLRANAALGPGLVEKRDR